MKILLMLLLALLSAASLSCARKPVLPPGAGILRPEDRAEMEKYATEIEQVKRRLARGEKITDPNQACLLYFYGALGADRDLLDRMVKNGADVNAANTLNGQTALHLVVLEGSVEGAKLLLERGARLDVINQNGKTVLYDAVCGADPKMVKLLLDKGADPNVGELVFGQTPLYVAADDNMMEIAKILLDYKADPNAGMRNAGTSPLHMAAHKGNLAMAELLLARGADPNAKTKIGRTAMDVARDRKNQEMIELLKKNGAN